MTGLAPRISPPTPCGLPRYGTPLDVAVDEFARSVVVLPALDVVVSELVPLRCARCHDCRACQSVRVTSATRAGLDETMAEKVDRYEDSDLPEAAKVALRLTDAVIMNPRELTSQLCARAHDCFSDEELAELMLDIIKWSHQKALVALRLEPPVREHLSEITFDESGKAMVGPALPSRLDSIPSLADKDWLQHPYPVLDRIRESAPVYRDPSMAGIAMVTGYDEIKRVLSDPETFSNDAYERLRTGGLTQDPRVVEALADGIAPASTLGQADGARHDFHVSLVKPFLSGTRIRAMTPSVQAHVDTLLERLPYGEPFDWVDQFAEPLTINVMCDFVGVPAEDRSVFARGSDAEVLLIGSASDTDTLVQAAQDFVRLQRYAEAQLLARRADPTDDLISSVANGTPPGGVDPLTMPDRVQIIKTTFAAGNQTTRAALSSAVLLLARQPELAARIRATPSALKLFVEEVLRLESPVTALYRIATRDAEIGGERIAAGERVAVLYGSGNRDPEQFRCPAEFDQDWENLHRHLAFGFGLHYCLGAPLARLELRLALTGLLERYERVELAPGAVPEYASTIVVRNLVTLPIVGSRAT